MKTTELYFPVVLFIMVYKVVLSFESVDKIPKLMKAIELYFPLLLFSFVISLENELCHFWGHYELNG